MAIKTGTRIQLSTMMFLEFFIWGAWYVTLSTYLFKIGFDGISIGAAYSTVNWGAIIAPFFVGMIADRFFSAEKVMGVIHFTGGIILWILSGILTPVAFFWTLLLYALCYMPTLALANAICFNQMDEPGKEFPSVRVLGTIGWIVAGLIIGFMKIEDTNIPLKIAAGVSIIMGIYSFFLPKTPPKSTGQKITVSDVLGLDALRLLKDRSFAIFIMSSLLISIPLAFYYAFTNGFLNEMGMENAAGKMTMGQMSEIIFMLLMPLFFVRLGVKKMLLIGMIAWALRYVLFAYGNNEELVSMYYVGILLHGICYDFFFVTGQIYVDQSAPKKIQASAQGLITLITYGIGMLIGSWIAGFIVKKYTTGEGEAVSHHWEAIWLVPALMAIIVAFMFLLFFRENKIKKEPGANES